MPAVDSPPAPVHIEQSHFDLAASAGPGDRSDLDLSVITASPCATPAQDPLQDTIVVCGTQSTRHDRLQVLAGPGEHTGGLGKAQFGVGRNATVGVQAETANFGSADSNRVMITYKLKY